MFCKSVSGFECTPYTNISYFDGIGVTVEKSLYRCRRSVFHRDTSKDGRRILLCRDTSRDDRRIPLLRDMSRNDRGNLLCIKVSKDDHRTSLLRGDIRCISVEMPS